MFMESKPLSAVILTLIMVLSGCLGTDSDVEDTDNEDVPQDVNASLSFQEINAGFTVGEVVIIEALVDITPNDLSAEYEYDLISSRGIENVESSLTETQDGISLIFVPNIPGTWVVNVRLIVEGLDDSIKYQMTFTIQVPDEGDTIISIVPIIEIENQTPLTIAGKVFHSNVSSCLVNIGEQKIVSPNEFGEFSYSYQPLEIEESFNLTVSAVCGEYTSSTDSRNVRIILLTNDDADGDGVPDDADSCPDGYGENDGWVPNDITDRDGDGCHDFEEDRDDDNDLIPDIDDDCASEIGWISNAENDYDRDGCSDSSEDNDDDNDGIDDTYDSCPTGEIGWESKPYTDWDGVGCRDLSEDLDDDNDQVNDIDDSCWRGISNWYSNSEFDYDGDGCQDSSEDEDDSSDDSSSDDEGILEEISDIKKEVDNIKYRKHKLSLKCMSNVTPKVYNNKFRGWGLTYWGD